MRIGPHREPEPTLEELGRQAEIDLARAKANPLTEVGPKRPKGISVADLINKK